MNEKEWKEFLESLSMARRWLNNAALLMDGIEGFAPGGEHAVSAAHSGIDAVEAIEVDYRRRALAGELPAPTR